MKLSEIKHDHSLTELLKVFIFSILMLLPFLSVLTRSMYVTFNKNAYQSYSGNYTYQTYTIEKEYETNEVNSVNDLVEGNIYHFYYDEFTEPTRILESNKFYYLKINNENNINVVQNTNSLYLYYNSNSVLSIAFNNTDLTYARLSNQTIEFVDVYFIYQRTNQFMINNINSISASDYLGEETIIIETHENTALDNVFEYSFQRMSEDDMFNWTQNTALYNGIHAMTTNLQIQTNVIAILLTYWTILTIVYVIIDIVLKCFTLLTHGFSRKTS